eukprot:766771-Hanusia_phi.AAC.1
MQVSKREWERFKAVMASKAHSSSASDKVDGLVASSWPMRANAGDCRPGALVGCDSRPYLRVSRGETRSKQRGRTERRGRNREARQK